MAMPNLDEVLLALLERGYEVALAGPVAKTRLERCRSHQNLHCCETLIDLDVVAPQCDLALTNGNHGSTLRLLSAGVPVIALPIYIEQEVNSENLVRNRLGAFLRPLNTQQLTQALNTVSDLSVKQRCQEFSIRTAPIFAKAEATAKKCIEQWMSSSW